jgi:hypothetical protein
MANLGIQSLKFLRLSEAIQSFELRQSTFVIPDSVFPPTSDIPRF